MERIVRIIDVRRSQRDDPQVTFQKELTIKRKIRELKILQKVTGHRCNNLSAELADGILERLN